MIRKLWHMLFGQSKIRALPRHLVRQFDMLDFDYDTLLVLMTARAKDPVEVQKLMKRHGVDNAADLIKALPPRRKPSFKSRLLTFFQRIEGSYPAPPENRRRKPQRTGIRGTSVSKLYLRFKDE